MQIKLGSMEPSSISRKDQNRNYKNVIFTCFTQNLGYVQWVAIVDG